jgi:hypothetical protein
MLTTERQKRTYIHTYQSRFIPEGVAELSLIFPQDTHVLPKLVSYEERSRRDRWSLIAVWSQSISGVNAINPLATFYDIHGRKREVLFFYLSRTPHETTKEKDQNHLLWRLWSYKVVASTTCLFQKQSKMKRLKERIWYQKNQITLTQNVNLWKPFADPDVFR